MQNFAKKTFLDLSVVMLKVKEDSVFARMFVKNPMRQSIHEEEAAKFIQENKEVVKFEKLPASGQNSLFLHNGNIISKKERDELKLSLKSVDFYWEVKTKTGKPLIFYASHKYTNEEG
jgi:sRNA-binding carbon storage regulator CsrA